jgi:selenium metabolism protein YedF
MNEMKWEKLADVQGHMEADVIKSFLEAEGVPVELFQESVGRHIYPTTVNGLARVQLFVPKEKADEARKLFAAYQTSTYTPLNRDTMDNTIILVTNNGMGNADETLQQKLIGKYFELIQQNNSLPNAICFYTNGVKLVVEGSPILEQLKSLEEAGVRLIVCSTCLEYFDLTEKVQVGIVGGMTDIIEAQVKAEKVITL